MTLLERLNDGGEAFLTHTTVGGAAVLRVAIGAPATTREHVERVWALLCQAHDWLANDFAEQARERREADRREREAAEEQARAAQAAAEAEAAHTARTAEAAIDGTPTDGTPAARDETATQAQEQTDQELPRTDDGDDPEAASAG
jgi:aromatic-L-amino-acid decarboxylase